MPEYKMLIADDDQAICDTMRSFFENEGYQVKVAADGMEAINLFYTFDPDIVLLDIVMPKKDGRQICREIRESSQKPIIMVSAKCEVFDKILGLELGADDFVTKPFDINELSARVKAVLRRCNFHPGDIEEVVRFENLEISRQKYELKIRGIPVDVPPKELELLYFLASHANCVYNRNQLLDKVWGFEYYGDSRTVDVHIKRLREKLQGVSAKWQLKTVWGVGYKFEILQA